MTTAQAEKLRFAADNWCPLNCKSGSDRPGFMVEVAQRVFEPLGYEVEYIETNWSRAVQETRKGSFHAILGAFPGDARDFIFPQQELALLQNSLFVRRENPWRYRGVHSLREVRLGAINGYDYGAELSRYLASDSNPVTLLSGSEKPLQRGIRMLHKQRLDAFVEADLVFWYTASQMELEEAFTVAGTLGEPLPAYIAFSPSDPRSETFARLLSEGVEALRASGELARILARYHLQDWR
ncbi:substrate-binding periplasmic protein [Neptuniibacter halophilus]|uniref:substrate-binding periplasmic protein n=1 Tax=Neptuniibacter halophilus TaxID=651666 RepID=UPI002572D3DF|nr:transporter substrate-binding domain-containing protein [Neptuniibacter halophilus]